MGLSWGERLVVSQVDGPTLTTAAAASCIPPASKFTLDPNFFDVIGKKLIIEAWGRISCAVTTPGTARYDIRFNGGATPIMDSLAMNLNIVAKTNVGWHLLIEATCRAIGTTGNLHWQGFWESEAVIGSPLPTVGGSGKILLPVATAPTLSTNFDTTIAQQVDMFFTQTVATGSQTCHQYDIFAPNN